MVQHAPDNGRLIKAKSDLFEEIGISLEFCESMKWKSMANSEDYEKKEWNQFYTNTKSKI